MDHVPHHPLLICSIRLEQKQPLIFVSMFLNKIWNKLDLLQLNCLLHFCLLLVVLLLNKKIYILTCEDVIGTSPYPFNFIYRLFARKHVLDIVLSNLPNFGEADLSTDANILEFSPMWGAVRGHILNVLM